MQWVWLIFRVAQGTVGYCLGGALTFAVAGLAEGFIAGALLALILWPSDKFLATQVVSVALSLGACTGFISGLFAFTMAGFIQTLRAEFHHHYLLHHHIPRDAAFWNCMRSALWASANFALAGAVTGGFGGTLWGFLNPPSTPFAPQTLDYETLYILNGSAIGAAAGYLAGVTVGALAPNSVQIARRRLREWRETAFRVWHQARTEWQR